MEHVDIVWKTASAEYGRERVNLFTESARERLIELLNDEWQSFGEDGDSIVIDLCDDER
jgi:hypothetical protein